MSAMVVSTTGNVSALAGSERTTRARARRRMVSPGGSGRRGRSSASVVSFNGPDANLSDTRRKTRADVRCTGCSGGALLQLLHRFRLQSALLVFVRALSFELFAPLRQPLADRRLLAVLRRLVEPLPPQLVGQVLL